MKKHLPTITIFTIIIGVIALGIYFSEKNSPIKELAKLDVYSEEELSFLEEQGFLNNIDSENMPSNKEQIVSLLKSVNLIEQNLNSPDESFEVLATKLDENTYQLAFKLENKSNQSKEFYLIPVSDESQLQFKEIKGRISGSITEVYNTPLAELYDVEEHKLELKPELAQAYDDIDNNGYTGKPIRLVLNANSTLLAQSKWEINRDRVSDSLEPVYLLVYGSAGGAMDELYKDTSFEKLDKVEKIKENHFKIKYDKYTEVELGNLETDDFEPTAKLKKWGDETYIKVSYPTTKKIKPKQEDKKLKWKDDKVEVHFYPLEPREITEGGHTFKQLEQGGFEFEIILKEKPATNKMVLDIETKGLKFYYQPELHPDHPTWSDNDGDGEPDNFRPENVVGSYAVYHATKRDHIIGQTNYKAGKAFHIYRPRIEDAEGHWVWGELHYDEQAGTLTTTIPQDFLDNAVYPIRHAAGETFGNTTSAATQVSTDNQMVGSRVTGAAGTATKLTAIVLRGIVGEKQKAAIYDNASPAVVITNGATDENSTTKTFAGWEDFLFSVNPTVSAVAYNLVVWGDGTNTKVFWDEGTGVYIAESATYNGFSDVAAWDTDLDNYFVSIYVTYTPPVENNAPTISSVTDSPDPVVVGSDITFSVDWNDEDEGDEIKIHICKENGITGQTCDGTGSWCDSADFTTNDPETCTYTTQSGDMNGSKNYYAFVCDDDDACSSSDSGTFTVVTNKVKLRGSTIRIKGAKVKIK